nr:restriction endonuclease subunit S [Oxynema sp. CENA135]
MAVIRGTDFSSVRYGDLSQVPIRFIPSRLAARKQLQENDILIETAGGTKNQPTGRTVFLKSRLFKKSNLSLICASFSRFLRVDSQLAEPEYVFWYLQYLYETGEMEKHQIQHTGVARFQYTNFAETVKIPLPPLDEQKAIAHILGTLDDKIELNQQMNQTLEAIARTIFKSWFIDFDPVRAKMEGRQPAGMDAETAALFPDEFEDSPLGKIPKGWRVTSLDQIADFLNGLALQKYPPDQDDYLPVIKIAELRKGITKSSGKASPNIDEKYIIQDGDVLFSWSGSLEAVIWCGGKGALNQHLFKITSKKYPKYFYYEWVKFHLPEFRSIAASKATTMGHIQRHHLTAALVVVPPSNVIEAANQKMIPLLENLILTHLESRTIISIRDTLLPKLLSGEIRVKDAEKVVEEVT